MTTEQEWLDFIGKQDMTVVTIESTGEGESLPKNEMTEAAEEETSNGKGDDEQ